MKKNFNIYYMRDHLKVVHMKWIAKSYCYKAPISDLWWSLKFLLVWYHWQRLYVISSNFFSMNLNFITLLLMLTKRRSINTNLWHTCESPSATCLYMLYEIHDGKAVLSCCLHLHTPQGIYSICQIKPILVKCTNCFAYIRYHGKFAVITVSHRDSDILIVITNMHFILNFDNTKWNRKAHLHTRRRKTHI
jgi:hypothetical protein